MNHTNSAYKSLEQTLLQLVLNHASSNSSHALSTISTHRPQVVYLASAHNPAPDTRHHNTPQTFWLCQE